MQITFKRTQKIGGKSKAVEVVFTVVNLKKKILCEPASLIYIKGHVSLTQHIIVTNFLPSTRTLLAGDMKMKKECLDLRNMPPGGRHR